MTTGNTQFGANHTIIDGKDHLDCWGIIDENVNLVIGSWPQKLGKRVSFRMRDIEWINSSGMRAWALFMRAFIEGREVSFEECSPAVIQQVNMVPNFIPTGSIRSFVIPFACNSCSTRGDILAQTSDFKPSASKPLDVPLCTKCGESMSCQEELSEYLVFVQNS